MSKYSQIQVFPIETAGKIVARGSFVVAESVKVNFNLVNGAKGFFVALPQEKDRKGKKDEDGRDVYYPLARFVDKETSQEVTDLIVPLYESKVGEKPSSQQAPAQAQAQMDDLPF